MVISNVLTDEFEAEVWAQESIFRIISKAMQRPDFETFKFNGDMLRSSKPLCEWAVYITDHYVGTYDLMVKFRTLQRTGSTLSPNQLAVALNSLLNTWKRSVRETKKTMAQRAADDLNDGTSPFDQEVDLSTVPTFRGEITSNPQGGRPSIEPQDTIAAAEPKWNAPTNATVRVMEGFKAPQSGTYTYVNGDGEYRVLKFDEYMGSTFISYQNGSDNDNNFAKFGKIDSAGKLHIWSSAFFKQQKIKISTTQRAELYEAVQFICGMDPDQLLKSGEAYALRSGRCFMCGRTLTVPSSISAGLGPICAAKWGI